MPATSATTNSWAMVSTPAAAATGTEPMTTSRDASHAISIGRLASRSTTSPAGSAMIRNGSVLAVASRPTLNVDACSRTTAISGTASRVTAEPSSLTAWPDHSSRKSRCRHSPGGRSRGASGT